MDIDVLDELLHHLLTTPIDDLNGFAAPNVRSLLTETNVRLLLGTTRALLWDEPMVLQIDAAENMGVCDTKNRNHGAEANAPIFILGSPFADLHNFRHIMLHITRFQERLMSGDTHCKMLILGNFCEHGTHPVLMSILCCALKARFPHQFFLIRGKHECGSICRIYGLYDDCKKRYNIKMFKTFVDVFNCLPVAAVIGTRLLCLSQGISPEVPKGCNIVDMLLQLPRPTDVPDTGVLCDILWSSYDETCSGWEEYPKEVSYTFGPDALKEFFQNQQNVVLCGEYDGTSTNDISTHAEAAKEKQVQHTGLLIDRLITSSLVIEGGFSSALGGKLMQIFSASRFRGEFDNRGGVAIVNSSDLSVQLVSFDV